MDKTDIFQKVLNSLDNYYQSISISSIEFVENHSGSLTSLYNKTFDTDFAPMTFNEILEQGKLDNATEPAHLTLSAKNGTGVYCSIYPVLSENENHGYLVIQHGKPFGETGPILMSFTAEVLSVIEKSCSMEKATTSTEHKFKEELMNMRNIQAKLFPKFEDLTGLDIASVYLPIELMTGTFIDAQFLDNTNYQIVTCDITGYDASSSFAGASIRTLVRSFSSKSIVPSGLIELITSKLSKVISGIHALIYITVFQINTQTGRAKLSSYGDISTYFFSSKKKGVVPLSRTSIGQDLSKRNIIKDITLQLEVGDVLLYFSSGTRSVTTEDGSQVIGEERLLQHFIKNIKNPSLDIVHNLTDVLYAFSN